MTSPAEVNNPSISDSEFPTLNAATDYALRGWKVVVLHNTQTGGRCSCGNTSEKHLRSCGKHPIHADWQEHATTDEAIIESEFKKRPDANLGVQMGPQSDLVDFECDDEEAEKTFLWLCGGDPPIVPTYSAKRGKHRLFKFRADLPRKSNIKIGGLEIRTGNGEPKPGKKESGQQSVFPPSVRHLPDGSLVEYKWLVNPDDANPGEITDEMLARIADMDGEKSFSPADHKPGAASLDVLRDAVEHLNPKRADDYTGNGAWLDVGMALYQATEGSDDGMQLWDGWSQKSTKYQAGACVRKWKSFSTGGGRQLTVGSLFFWAKLDTPGWKPPKRTDQPNETVDDPHRLAREFVAKECTNIGSERTLVFHRDEFHQHNGVYYQPMPSQEIKSRLTAFIKNQFDAENLYLLQQPELWHDKEQPPKCRKVTTTLVGNTLAALQGATLLLGQYQPPYWLDSRNGVDPADIMATRSGLLVLPRLAMDDCLLKPTANFYSPNGVDYAYEPNAVCPSWLNFLNTLWPSDEESINTLQDWIGYLLLPDTQLHKILMLIGPPRSGKGTIGRVIKRLIGENNLACPTLGSLAGPFGLWPLLGRIAAVIADARLSGRTDAIAVVERLLSISGEDPQDIHRKNLPTLTGVRLPVRFMLMTNELPNMRDASGALTSRVILLRLTRSFLGKEDKALDRKLAAELPGILNWALIGWQRVRSRGTLIQPETGHELLADLDDLASPIKQFIRECCHVGLEFSASVDEAFMAWRVWCDQHGRANIGTKENFGKDLRAALPQVRVVQSRSDGSRLRIYVGIGVRSDLDGTGWHASRTYARGGEFEVKNEF